MRFSSNPSPSRFSNYLKKSSKHKRLHSTSIFSRPIPSKRQNRIDLTSIGSQLPVSRYILLIK